MHCVLASSNGATDAYNLHNEDCGAYANLAIAMLRQLGIPAQAAYSWISADPIRLKGKHGSDTIQWSHPGTSGEFHVWVNVYFPDAGWVPFDSQLEKFFVDPRHIALLVAKDASTLTVGAYSGSEVDNASFTGAALPDGGVEALPGVSGVVTLNTADSFDVKLGSLTGSVSNTVLLSR
jgi:hypothetical protein